MKSCNRVIISILLFAGCGSEPLDLTTAVIQNVGLVQTSGVPPLGEAIAPVTGYPGAGSAVVTSVGGQSSGPGAITWHGGQWLMAYPAQPGTSLQNVACDVVPNSTSTDLVELVSSNGQVLGSSTVPATTGVVIRTWIVLSGGHPVVDGEQVVLRHSPKDSTTGQWTGAGQDLTVIGCYANTTTQHVAFYHVSSGSSIIIGGQIPSTGPYSTQLIIGSNTEAQFPLNMMDSTWTITGVRVYMAQTPTGTPTYNLVSDMLGSSGFSGFQSVSGTTISTGALVVDLPITTGIRVAGPVHLHAKTDAGSTTSLGAVQLTYTIP